MAWEVKIISKGPYGYIDYIEDGQTHQFFWEFCGGNTVASITVPKPDEWDTEVPWARGRREEILNRVATETIRQQARSCSIRMKDQFIEIVSRKPRQKKPQQ